MRTHASLVLALMAGGSVASAQELFIQVPFATCGGPSSQDARNPGGIGWFSEAADDFPAEADWRIGAVEFWGGYCTPADSPGNTEGFSIRFYSSGGNIPGTLLYEVDVFTFTETQYADLGFAVGYHYHVDLPTPFEPGVDGDIWVSVVAILARGGGAQEPQWGWATSPQRYGGPAAQWFFDPHNFQPDQNNSNLSFALFAAEDGCAADLSGSSDPNDLAYGLPDGTVDAADFFFYLDQFAAGIVAIADLSGSSDPNDPSYGVPDGALDASDFFYYLDIFVAGCP